MTCFPLQASRCVSSAAFALLLGLFASGQCTVISDRADAEIAELHAGVEGHWDRIANLTVQLQAVGAIAGSAPGSPPGAVASGTGPALGPRLDPHGQPTAEGTVGGTGGTSSAVPPGTLRELQKLQAEFAELQQQAFKIGREAGDNEELRQHPGVNDYLQGLRSLEQRLKDMVGDLQRAYRRATGREAEGPTKKRKARKQIRGLSEEEIRARARAAVEEDARPFRSKAMDLVSEFREWQLQMQDKQRDLQLTMDGPDWPKEDWPLTTADAKHVGEAEQMISGSLRALSARLEPLGGLGRVPESGDAAALEQLKALSEMMAGYCELIDRHVATVKRTQRARRRPPAPRKRAAAPPRAGAPAEPALAAPGLRDRLLSFGSPASGRQPFAWLREEGASGVPVGLPGFGAAAPPGGGAAPWGLGASGAGTAGAGGASGLGAGPSSGSPLGAFAGGGAFAGFAGAGSSAGAGIGAGPLGAARSSLGSLGAFGEQHVPLQARTWPAGAPRPDGGTGGAHVGEL